MPLTVAEPRFFSEYDVAALTTNATNLSVEVVRVVEVTSSSIVSQRQEEEEEERRRGEEDARCLKALLCYSSSSQLKVLHSLFLLQNKHTIR